MAAPEWFASLQFRLILAFTLALALALGAVGFLVSFTAGVESERFQTRSQEFRAGRVHRIIARHYAENRRWEGVQPSLEQAATFYGRRFLVTDEDGRVVADSHRPGNRGSDGKRAPGPTIPIVHEGRQVGFLVLERGLNGGPPDGDAGVGGFGSSVPPGPPPPQPVAPGAAVPGSEAEPLVSRVTASVNRMLLVTGLAAAMGGMALVFFASRRILAPLQTLGNAARRLGQGDLDQRVTVSGPAEFRQLGDTFNNMAENLQTAERQRRNLTADVAHELRTPLSNIQGYLDAVHDGLLPPDEATIATLRQQTTHLVALVEDLRLLAMADAGSLSLQTRPEAVATLLEELVEAFRPRAEAGGISLTLEIPDSLPLVELDPTRIAQALSNLLENAMANTPSGGAVAVTAVPRAAEDGGPIVAITVSDTGPGIGSEDLNRVFDRFYRVDPSRSRATGGAGLGLTIARQLVEAHGGTIWVDSEPGRGASFTFTLPASR